MAIFVLLAVVAYLLIFSMILKVAGRIVMGRSPTFGSCFATLLAVLIASALLGWGGLALGLDPQSPAALGLSLASILLQAVVYSWLLHDEQGSGISFGQALLVLLLQIPVAIVLVFATFMVFATAGGTIAALLPDRLQQLHLPFSHPASATPAPAPGWPASTRARLLVPLSLSTRYGQILVPAGTEVQVRGESAGGYRVLASGSEIVVAREQLVFLR